MAAVTDLRSKSLKFSSRGEEDRQIFVGVFPKIEQVQIGSFAFGSFCPAARSNGRVPTRKADTQSGHRIDTVMTNDLLKFCLSLGGCTYCQIG